MRIILAATVPLQIACLQTPNAGLDSDTGDGNDSNEPWLTSTVEVSDECGLEFNWTPGIAGLAPPYYLEDDTILIEASCSRDVDVSRLSIAPLNLPPSAQWDPVRNTFSYPTDGSHGGRIDLLFSAKIVGDEAFPETKNITFWIGDNPSAVNASSPVPEVRRVGPAMFHESDGSIGTTSEAATITFDGVTYPAEIQKRGAVSIYYPKNSFGLRFDEPELDLEAHGIERRRDHLVLITPFDDNSYIRQRLIYELWREMAQYWGASRLTPRTFFAVLYLDGRYHGVYTASDRIDDEFAFHMGLNKEGNLYKAVNHDANFYLTTNGGAAKTTLAAGFEKKEGQPLSGEDAFEDLIELVQTTGSSPMNSNRF